MNFHHTASIFLTIMYLSVILSLYTNVNVYIQYTKKYQKLKNNASHCIASIMSQKYEQAHHYLYITFPCRNSFFMQGHHQSKKTISHHLDSIEQWLYQSTTFSLFKMKHHMNQHRILSAVCLCIFLILTDQPLNISSLHFVIWGCSQCSSLLFAWESSKRMREYDCATNIILQTIRSRHFQSTC